MPSLPALTQPAAYRIRFLGRVQDGWADFMTGLQAVVSPQEGASVTELTGTVADQPALFGLLCRLRDLGLPLISVEFLPPPEASAEQEKLT